MQLKFRKYLIILMYLLAQLYTLPTCAQLIPEKPILNYVSVDSSTQKIIMNWDSSRTANILYYTIYAIDIGTFPVSGTEIGTVSGNTLSYEMDIDAFYPSIYSITATDAIGESLLSGDYHQPIELDMSYDSCSEVMNLRWNKYIGWKGNLNGYRVLYREEGAAFRQVAILDTSTLSYAHKGISENSNYEYLIRAFDNMRKSSFSNRASYFTYMPPPPSYVNLDYVTVIDDLSVEISFSSDLSGEIDDFRLMRSSSLQTPFTNCLTFMDIGQSPFTMDDQVATQGAQYYYRVDALNGCLDPISSSNTGTNIVLTGMTEGSIATLSWNPYTVYEGSLEGYSIYRINPSGEYDLINTVGPEANTYIEDISLIGQDTMKGEISYRVLAKESDDNPYGVMGESQSNELTLSIETKLYMPNAFTPNDDGLNDIFGPVLDFTPSSYRMLIYDRSGKMLFQTTDPYDGWDGTLNGSTLARQGVYIYHLEYTSYSGVRKVETGNLSLINP
jgi:gliding motility-associated-like protein